MSNPMTPELYAQLAQSANAKRLAKNKLNPFMPEFYGTSSSPRELALNGVPQRYLPNTLEDEAELNMLYNQMANDDYDRRQTYALDLADEHDANLDANFNNAYIEDPEDGPIGPIFGAKAFELDGPTGEMWAPPWGSVGAPENPQVPALVGQEDPLKTMFTQLIRTGGSMAMPMLMGALMRGGK